MKKIKTLLLAFAIISIASLSSNAHAGSYTFNIIDLGTVGNDTASYARSINNSTTIVGDSVSSGGDSRGFVWSQWQNNAQMQSLSNGKHNTNATAIDSSGVILGGTDKRNRSEAGTWRSYSPTNGMQNLGNTTIAYNINDNGQILASNGNASQTKIYSIWGGAQPCQGRRQYEHQVCLRYK